MKFIMILGVILLIIFQTAPVDAQQRNTCSFHKKGEVEWCKSFPNKKLCDEEVDRRMTTCMSTGAWNYRRGPVSGLTRT